jgi:hypothetical protein
VVQAQLYAGMKLGIAVVALVASFVPRPPRALVTAVLVAVVATLAGPLFSGLTSTVPWVEIVPMKKELLLYALLGLVLLGSTIARNLWSPATTRSE